MAGKKGQDATDGTVPASGEQLREVDGAKPELSVNGADLLGTSPARERAPLTPISRSELKALSGITDTVTLEGSRVSAILDARKLSFAPGSNTDTQGQFLESPVKLVRDGRVFLGRKATEGIILNLDSARSLVLDKGEWILQGPEGRLEKATPAELQKGFSSPTIELESPYQKFIKSLPLDKAVRVTEPTLWRNPDAVVPKGLPPWATAQIPDAKLVETPTLVDGKQANKGDWILKLDDGSKLIVPPQQAEQAGYRTAQAGDYFAYPKGQAPYAIPGADFHYIMIPGSGEWARTSFTTAQVLTGPETAWSPSAGLTKGAAGDYLITRDNGTQEILSKKKFEDQFALAEQSPEQREPLNKPKATGERFLIDPERGVQAEQWEHGFILYDKNVVTILDDRDGTYKEYTDGRLSAEAKNVGNKLVTTTYPYGDLEAVRTLPNLDSYKELLKRNEKLAMAQKLADETPSTHDNKSPERIALQQKLRTEVEEQMNALRQKAAKDGSGAKQLESGRVLHIVLGLSGSGKSTIANEIAEQTHAFVVDPDELKPKMPEWRDGIGAAATSREANEILYFDYDKDGQRQPSLMKQALSRGDNLVVPAVGASTHHLEKLIQEAKAQGYEVHLSLVDIPPTEAMKRIVGRMEAGGLYVDPTYLASLGNRPLENFKSLVQKYFVDSDVINSYHQINNMGRPPVLVERGRTPGAPDSSGLERQGFFGQAKSTHDELAERSRRLTPDMVSSLAQKLVTRPEGKLARLAKTAGGPAEVINIADMLVPRSTVQGWIEKGIPEADLQRMIATVQNSDLGKKIPDATRLLSEMKTATSELAGSNLEVFVKELLKRGEAIHQESITEKSGAGSRVAGAAAAIVTLMAIAAAALQYSDDPRVEKVRSRLGKINR